MKKSINLILLLSLALVSWQCSGSENEQAASEPEMETDMEDTQIQQQEPSLTLLWETSEDLTTCESVLYDESDGTLYVANINGDPTEKNGEGFISTISQNGDILELEWLTGLNAPKGMGVHNGTLYVTDIDELVEIDIESASVVQRYPVDGAEFLNDTDTDPQGRVFFSDSRTGTIHVLEDGEIRVFSENQEGINGLRVDTDGTLYGLDSAGLKRYDSDGTAHVINDVVTGGDGLIILGEDTFLASRWQGEIWIITGDTEHKLLDTKEEESNTADIEYVADENLVLVPTFFKNKVTGYRLDY